MLETAIRKAKELRVKFTVVNRNDDIYQICTTDHCGRMLSLELCFYKLGRRPDYNDNLYFSENLFDGLNEGLYSYQFSAEIGWPCARQPHDFLLNPKEFLILEYSDGTTILLEEVYG